MTSALEQYQKEIMCSSITALTILEEILAEWIPKKDREEILTAQEEDYPTLSFIQLEVKCY